MSITNIYIGFWCFLKYWWELYVMYQKHWTFGIFPRCYFWKNFKPTRKFREWHIEHHIFTYLPQHFVPFVSQVLCLWTICKWVADINYFLLNSATRSPKSTNNLLCNHSVIITLRTINVDLHYLNSWQVSLLLRVQSVTHSWLPLVFWLIETT